jgi:hypothetical protein
MEDEDIESEENKRKKSMGDERRMRKKKIG